MYICDDTVSSDTTDTRFDVFLDECTEAGILGFRFLDDGLAFDLFPKLDNLWPVCLV
jgi:hypothetical protein